MREKLAVYEGKKITLIGILSPKQRNKTRAVLCDVLSTDGEYLCDHMWLSGTPRNMRHINYKGYPEKTILVVTGTIKRYERTKNYKWDVSGEHKDEDYGIVSFSLDEKVSFGTLTWKKFIEEPGYFKKGSVAQRSEQQTHNLTVEGSTPSGSTKFMRMVMGV